MGLYPNSKSGKIGYFNSKLSPWNTNATAIGTTTTAVTALQTKVETAQEKLDAQIALEQAVKTATATADNAIALMVAAGMDVVKEIRAKAANSADPNTVYDLAEIPAPATPSPVNTLGMPSDLIAELGADGAVTVKWKCVSPRATGVVYQIWRRVGPDAAFTYLGGVGEKKYVDEAIPAGSSQVTYQLQAVRSTAAGPWAQFNVNFGMSGGETTIASITEGKPAKIAA